MDYTVHVHMHTNELIIIRFMDLSDYSSGHENSITMLLYWIKADIRLWEIGWTHRVLCPIFIFICSIYEVNLVPFVLLCLHVWKNVNADLFSVYIHNAAETSRWVMFLSSRSNWPNHLNTSHQIIVVMWTCSAASCDFTWITTTGTKKGQKGNKENKQIEPDFLQTLWASEPKGFLLWSR